ncbi:hypothetical protein PFISCL1PPCAC_28573, partial [Pristionchus fissidentatus]
EHGCWRVRVRREDNVCRCQRIFHRVWSTLPSLMWPTRSGSSLNAHQFLTNGRYAAISIKTNCIDSTAESEAAARSSSSSPQVTLESYERDHTVVVDLSWRP